MANWLFREPTDNDGQALASIYNFYIDNTVFILDDNILTTDEMVSRLQSILNDGYYLLVEDKDSGDILGFAYAKPWNNRAGYRYSFESSIYLKHDRDREQSKGLGTLLYQQLCRRLEADGRVRALVGVIVRENEASIRLHQKLDFRYIATFPQIGIKFGRWLDVDYWVRYFH